MTIYNEWALNISYRPQNLTKEASYRYEILIRYKRLREKGFSESEALEFLQVKRSTYFSWLKRYNNKCGTMRMKTTGLANKSRRSHNFRTTKVISTQLVSHILKIRQAEPMYGKEKIKRELEKDNIFVSVSTVGRVLKYLMQQNKIQNIHPVSYTHLTLPTNSLV